MFRPRRKGITIVIEVKGQIQYRAVLYAGAGRKSRGADPPGLRRKNVSGQQKIRIMPDVHAGKGCTIGTTMTITDKVVPGMVGVDIGCGMETVRIAQREIDSEKLDALIAARSCGQEVRGASTNTARPST